MIKNNNSAAQATSGWICVVAGKSGGHITPGLVLACQHQAQGKKILFFTTDSSLDKNLLHAALSSRQVDRHDILSLSSFSRSGLRAYFLRPVQLISAFIKSFLILSRSRPQSVISMGGLVSIPVCAAAWLLRIPIHLYELNAVAGKAVKFLAPCAQKVYMCFDSDKLKFARHKKVCVDYPLRFSDSARISPEKARDALGIAHDARVLLVLGGSQGSVFLNKITQDYIRYKCDQSRVNASLLNDNQSILRSNKDGAPTVVLHQAGQNNIKDLEDFYKNNNTTAHVFAYKNNIELYYSAADLVLARAGAGTLFELLFFNKQSIIVPLETKSTDHQVDNAHSVSEKYPRLFTVIRQTTFENNRQSYYELLEQALFNQVC